MIPFKVRLFPGHAETDAGLDWADWDLVAPVESDAKVKAVDDQLERIYPLVMNEAAATLTDPWDPESMTLGIRDYVRKHGVGVEARNATVRDWETEPRALAGLVVWQFKDERARNMEAWLKARYQSDVILSAAEIVAENFGGRDPDGLLEADSILEKRDMGGAIKDIAAGIDGIVKVCRSP